MAARSSRLRCSCWSTARSAGTSRGCALMPMRTSPPSASTRITCSLRALHSTPGPVAPEGVRLHETSAWWCGEAYTEYLKRPRAAKCETESAGVTPTDILSCHISLRMPCCTHTAHLRGGWEHGAGRAWEAHWAGTGPTPWVWKAMSMVGRIGTTDPVTRYSGCFRSLLPSTQLSACV